MFLQLSSCTLNLVDGSISGERAGRLTPRELSLFRYLADRAGLAVSRDELLCEAFGYRAGVVSRAVDKTMNTLRQKVEADSRSPDFLLTVDGGYCFQPRASPSPLPGEVDAFVGRQEEVVALRKLLDAPGICTVTGAGGVGKTRLAFRVAGADGREVVLCELDSVRGREGLIRAVAGAVGANVDSSEQISATLALRGRILVVLDNFEHLVEHSREVEIWRQAAPGATLLVTSRQPLDIVGERVQRLDPLTLDAAAELLLVRARERGVSIEVADDVRDLAARLDALPLALELAAVRMSVFTPADLLARIDKQLALLQSNARGTAPRHVSLLAAMDRSWELLDGEQQTALAQLSVFVGAFRLEAAESVLTCADRQREALAVFTELIDRSLVQRRSAQTRDDRLRFRLLDTVRAYAERRLDDLHPQSRADAELRHGAYFAAMAESTRPVDALLAMQEVDDLSIAVHRAIERGEQPVALKLGRMLIDCLQRRGSTHALAGLISKLLCFDGLEPAESADLHRGAAQAAFDLGDDVEGVRQAKACIATAREADDPGLEAVGVHWLGLVARYQDQWSEALVHYAEVSRLSKLAGDAFMEATNLLNMLDIYRMTGDVDRALECAYKAELLFDESDNPWGAARALIGLTVMHTDYLALEKADEALDRCQIQLQRAPDKKLEILVSIRRAQLCCARGDFDSALAHYETAHAACDETGVTDWERMSLVLGFCGIHLLRGDYPAARKSGYTALKLAKSVGSENAIAKIAGKIAAADALAGRRGALKELDEAIDTLRESNNHESVVQLLGHRARIVARTDRSAAMAGLREAEALIAEHSMPPRVRAALVLETI